MKPTTMLFAPESGDGSGGGLMGGGQNPPAGGGGTEDPTGGSGGQGGNQDPPASILTEDGNFSPQWYQGNEELTPFGKQLDKFTSPAALAKSYATLERNRTVPAEGAEDAAVEAFRKANGVPGTHEEYELKLPESMPDGVEVNEDAMAQYKEVFHGLHLTPYQAQKLTESHIEITGKMFADMQGQVYTSHQEAAANLQKEWGNAYDAKLEAAQGAFDWLCAKAGVNSEEVGFVNDPAFAKIMSAVAAITSESPVIGVGGVGQSFKGGKQEAHEVMTNKNHPDYEAFYNPQDPRHNEVQDRVARLNK